jgi:cation:H+ antiporter
LADSTAKQENAAIRQEKHKGHAVSIALIIFLIGAVATLAGGVALELSSAAIANKIGMSSTIFGATVLAAVTSLPEVSTGLAAIKLRDYELAVSDILGGNAFLPVLFVEASLLSGEAVLPHAHKTDIYLAGLGILLTVVYMTGMVLRSRRQVARMGLDSLAVLIIYALGMLGLAAIH